MVSPLQGDDYVNRMNELIRLSFEEGTETGRTALHHAVKERRTETVKLLISKNADVNAKDDRGDTPLNWANSAVRTELSELLRKHGGKTGEELKLLATKPKQASSAHIAERIKMKCQAGFVRCKFTQKGQR